MRRIIFSAFILGVTVVTVGCFDDVPSRRNPVFPPGLMQPGTVDEFAARKIARQAIAIADPRAEKIDFEAKVDGKGWWVLAYLRDIDNAGLPQAGGGTIRSIYIDERGNVTNYLRSK